jgi:DNA mismatch endonuclease (patch repair protein)
MPITNYEYWSEKIAGNVARDKKVTKELKSQRWKVIRIWEYDVKHNFDKSIQKIVVDVLSGG